MSLFSIDTKQKNKMAINLIIRNKKENHYIFY